MTGKTGIDLDVLTWFPPRRCGRNYDRSFQYSRLRLTNREWFRGKDHMGSHIPIRQLRRSSVNARPRGATPSGSCRFCHLPPSLQILCFEALPPGLQAQPWGLRPLSRDISSGFSDSLFFQSALFNSPVASGRPVSTFRKFLRRVSPWSLTSTPFLTRSTRLSLASLLAQGFRRPGDRPPRVAHETLDDQERHRARRQPLHEEQPAPAADQRHLCGEGPVQVRPLWGGTRRPG